MNFIHSMINAVSSYKVLNAVKGEKVSSSSAASLENVNSLKLALSLSQQIQKIYNKYVSDEGVDPAILKSDEFLAYTKSAQQLSQLDLGALSEVERRIFAINLYNALMIHGVFELGTPSNAISRDKFFVEVAYAIGPHVYSLNDLEHGILRNNAPHPASTSPTFSSNDPRAKFAVPLDPRIHCALVCGAKSCPPIRFYTPENWEKGLNGAASAFCRGHFTVEEPNTIETSMIFSWYEGDFLSAEERKLSASDRHRAVVKFMANHLEESDKKKALEISQRPDFKLKFEEYDWSSNFTH